MSGYLEENPPWSRAGNQYLIWRSWFTTNDCWEGIPTVKKSWLQDHLSSVNLWLDNICVLNSLILVLLATVFHRQDSLITSLLFKMYSNLSFWQFLSVNKWLLSNPIQHAKFNSFRQQKVSLNHNSEDINDQQLIWGLLDWWVEDTPFSNLF